MLGDVLGHLGDVRLEDVVAVQIGHFCAGLDPNIGLTAGCDEELYGEWGHTLAYCAR